MTSYLLRKAIAVASLLVFFLAGYGSALGLVWCHPLDKSVAAQPLSTEPAGSAVESVPASVVFDACCTQTTLAGTECVSCTNDFPARHALKSRTRLTRQAPPLPPLFPAAHFDIKACSPAIYLCRHDGSHSPLPSPSLAFLRTVVLLN